MKKSKSLILIPIALVVLVVAGLFIQNYLASEEPSGETAAAKKAWSIQHRRDQQVAKVQKKRAQRVKVTDTVERDPISVIDLDEDDEAKLNDFSRKILQDLQDALDSENFAIVSRLVMKMLETPPDPKFGKDGVVSLLRRKAVEALGWFGAKAIPELVGMLGDPDPEIVQATFDQFQLALSDGSLSDYERAQIVVSAAKVLQDGENLDTLFMDINNMRNSVGADALVQICLEGTDAAKALMPDAIELFTGDDNLQTVEDVENWLAENPDGEDDDVFYGGDTALSTSSDD